MGSTRDAGDRPGASGHAPTGELGETGGTSHAGGTDANAGTSQTDETGGAGVSGAAAGTDATSGTGATSEADETGGTGVSGAAAGTGAAGGTGAVGNVGGTSQTDETGASAGTSEAGGASHTGGAGDTGGTSETAGVSGAGGAAPIPCPDSPPASGEVCAPSGPRSCAYEDCAGAGRTVATCQDATWSTESSACESTVYCSGGSGWTCGSGQICLYVASGWPVTACLDNTCGAGPVSCDCIPDCPVGCSVSATSSGITIYCNPCGPSGCV